MVALKIEKRIWYCEKIGEEESSEAKEAKEFCSSINWIKSSNYSGGCYIPIEGTACPKTKERRDYSENVRWLPWLEGHCV